MKSLTFGLSAVAALMLTVAADAADVKVEGVHLCCGACVRDVGKAFADAKGVSGVACDRDAGTVSFTAESKASAKAGIKVLAKAGFGGKASVDGKAVEYPSSGAKKGTKADAATFAGVHLCCGGCVKAVNAALEGVDGVESVEVDRSAKTVSVSGKGIDVGAVYAALHKKGFHGNLKKK